ncbi:MAG TPA: hypothetical protein EYP09_11410 [Anaerolineae bacterium]|nr:hypothetical protein [Anaerolineae bacterium]
MVRAYTPPCKEGEKKLETDRGKSAGTSSPLPTPGTWKREWPFNALLLALIALAFARGVCGLGSQSLWWDESLSLYRATHDPLFILSNRIVLSDTVNEVVTIDNHPPLYFLLLHLFVRLGGDSEFTLRFPSLIFSVLTVPLLYAVGRYLFDRPTGLLAALFGAVSPLYLWYSHEARMYTMLTFWGLLSFYTLLRSLSGLERKDLLARATYVLSSVAMVSTHYLGFLVLLSELAIYLASLRRAGWRRVAISAGVVIALALPLACYGLLTLPQGDLPGFRYIPLRELLRDVANSFSLGISVSARRATIFHWAFRAVFLAGLFVVARRAFHPSLKALSTLAYLVIPLLSMYLLSFVRPAYMNIRHLMMASPPFYLILAAGLAAIRKKWPLALAACLALMLAGTAYSTQQYFFNQKYAKDDHRAWGEYLKAHVQPGDVVVVDPPHIAQLYLYYADSGLPWTGLPRLRGSQEATVSALKDLMARYERIWLAFSYTPPWGDPDRLPQRWLEENAFLVDFRNFHSYASLVQTYCFLTEPPVLEDLPQVQHPARVNFEDKLLFLGYDLKGRPPTSGHFLRLNLYWQAQRALSEDYVVSLRLYDDQGHLWGQADRGPLNSHYPTSRWEPGRIVRDDFELFIGVGTPPGPYRLELVVHDGEQALEVWDEEGLAQGRAAAIGTVKVGKPASPPSPASLPMMHRRGRDFGGLQLLGYDLVERDRRAGDWVPVSLYWRAARKLEEDRVLHLRLVDGSDHLWAERAIRPAGDGYPTTLWDEGEVVRGQHALRIPPDAPGGDYRLELAFAGEALDLGTIRVLERERQFAVPPIQHPLRANLGDKVEFLGYDLGRTELRPGEALPLTLYWRALREMDVSYTVFTHLVGEDGRIWGQQDNPPQEGRCPTTLWVEGEVVTDEYRIPLKPEAPPGEYVLEIGLYDARTGERLPVLDGEGRVLDDKIVLAKIGVSK